MEISPDRAATVIAGGALAVGLAGATRGRSQAPDGQGRLRIDHYSNPAGGELIADIPVTGSSYRYSTLYALELIALRKGDVVQAHAQFEVTNPFDFPVMLAHAMLLHPKKTIVRDDPKKPREQRLCEYATENVTPGMRTGFRSLMGSFAAAEDGDAWVSVVVYAAITWNLPGLKLTVQKGYGGLRAVVYRNP
jgi:hypothetical protein